MAFIPYSYPTITPAEFVHTLPAQAGLALEPGMLLKLDGALQVAAGTDVPQYLCQCAVEATEEGQIVPVQPVRAGQAYLVADAPAGIAVGAHCAISSDGLNLAAGDGAALVTAYDADKAEAVVVFEA